MSLENALRVQHFPAPEATAVAAGSTLLEEPLCLQVNLSVADTFDEARSPRSVNFAQALPEDVPDRPAATPSASDRIEKMLLEAKYPDHLLHSGGITERKQAEQRPRAELLANKNRLPTLNIFICGTNADNESYRIMAEAYGEMIGVPVKVHRTASQPDVQVAYDDPMTNAELQMMSKISAVKRLKRGQGYLTLGPTETREGWRWIQATLGGPEVDPRELDGAAAVVPSEQEVPVAITSESIVYYAEEILGCKLEDLDPSEIAVAGNGGVGGPLRKRILEPRAIKLGVSLETRQDVEAAPERLQGKPLRLLFATARANSILKSRYFTPPTPDGHNLSGQTLIIDAGNAPHPVTGKSGGNVDTNTLPGSDVWASPFINGAGPVTVALLFDRLLNMAEQECRAEQSFRARVSRYVGSLGARLMRGEKTALLQSKDNPAPNFELTPEHDHEKELVNA